jgi:hypothetical protein
VTRADLERWAAALDAHEAKAEAKARKAGRLAVLDYVERCPLSPEAYRAVRQARDPRYREATLRGLASSRRKVRHLESLIPMLQEKGKPTATTEARLEHARAGVARLEGVFFL